MPKSLTPLNRLIKHSCWLLLLLFVSPCIAQTAHINELEQKLQQYMPDTARLKLLSEISTAYTSVDPVKKNEYARKCLALATKLHDDKGVADAYIGIAVSFSVRSMHDSSLNYYRIGYAKAEKIGYQLAMGRILTNIGYTYDRMDNSHESMKYYFQALEIFKKLKFARGINQCCTNIGSIYFDLKQYKLAESYFNQCLDSYTAGKDSAGVAYAKFTLANCYKETGRFDDAYKYYNTSLDIRRKLGDNNGVALVLKGLGILYEHEHQYTKALQHLQQAHGMIVALQDKYEEASVLLDLTDVYLDLHDYNNAEKSAQQALTNSRLIKTDLGISESLERLVKVYAGKNDMKKAFKVQSQYVAMEDSLLEQKALKDVTLAEYGRVRTENAELTRNNQSYTAQINHYSNVIVSITIVLVLLILLALMQYRRYLEKQTANRLLQEQKNEIAHINKELETLNEELTTQMELTAAQNTELERLNSIKTKFFSIISHDVRGPLSNLQSLFDIYHEGEIGKEEFGTLLARLEDTILVTRAFLDNLLEWSKSQLDGIVINPKAFDMSDCIDRNIQLCSSRISLKRLNVRNESTDLAIAHADPDMANLVVRNLLSNSIKFCNPGDEIKLKAERIDDKILFSVADTGPGISAKDRERLFSLEYASTQGTQGEKGSHLGLILCRDMVEQNNGRIWFETQEGQGTTFWVELPVG